LHNWEIFTWLWQGGMKEVYGCCLIYQDSVKLCSKHKEKWGEGVSLPNTSFALEEFSRHTIE